MSFKQQFQSFQFNGFKPANLMQGLHPIIALLVMLAVSVATIALLPFLIIFIAITLISAHFFGRSLIKKAARHAERQQQGFVYDDPNLQRTPRGSAHAQPQGRTFEHQAD
ncbi:hypothetical protein EXU30_16070 [Shewanella maritima]|uniref:Uncharacterized protein n=1 Tax=Shewanella maritima TaxID=2520507 RepID=A0A411PKH3_9GAMM|nr:hypothetical protein [Shewanella maritima]QBF84019.1 hypothetical protein EXU30_16070 [Shewanella maritima]